MSIRMIAKDLYRIKQEVERLEEQLKSVSHEMSSVVEDRLRKARAEQTRMRRILDGAKEPPAYRRPL